MNLNSFLGQSVTTNTGKTVLVEDTYPKQRLCGKTEGGEFVVLSVDFIEVDMTEENTKWAYVPPKKATVYEQPVVEKALVVQAPVLIDLEQFTIMLQQHDWYYSYTDDGKVWRRGKDAEDEIGRIIRQGGVRYVEAYNENKPKDFAVWK